MRARDVVVFLAGSLVVGAACAAQNAVTNASREDAGRDAVGITDTREIDADAVGADVTELPIVDFGVPEASAEDATTPAAFTVDDVPCDQLVSGVWYAVKAYPGRSREDLARGKSIVCGLVQNVPTGFECNSSGFLVKDEGIAVQCGLTSKATLVRVVLPN